ncbi:hypothetical protein [Ferruginibacter sp.]
MKATGRMVAQASDSKSNIFLSEEAQTVPTERRRLRRLCVTNELFRWNKRQLASYNFLPVP